MSSSLGTLDRRFEPYARALVHIAHYYRLNPVVTSTYRSREEQQRLYARWIAGKSPLPAAVPGTSLHNFGLAFDMVARNQAWLGKVWSEYFGGRWGGYRDPVHYGAY